MGISAEVLKDPLGTIEGRFVIDAPLLMIELFPEGFEVSGLLEMADTSGNARSPDSKLFLGVPEELELSRNKYAELYDFAPVGYFTFDARGVIGEVNHEGAHLLGIERRQLLNRPFISFIPEAADSEILSKHREAIFQKQGNQTCEIRLENKIRRGVRCAAPKHSEGK